MLSKFIQTLTKYGLEYWNKYYGVYRGFVSDVDDPENLGRIKIKVPQIYQDKEFNYWALPKGIYSGKGIGAFFIPNVGDTIWVEFEGGNCRFPVWSYGWWAKGFTPEGAKPTVKILQTDKHRIELDDSEGVITIKDNNDNKIILNSTGVSIVSAAISLSKENGSSEAAALGDTLKSRLDDILDRIDGALDEVNNLTTVVSGVAGSTSPASKLTVAAQKVQLALLRTQLSSVLSQKVTLD